MFFEDVPDQGHPFLDLATDRAILSNLKMVLNPVFLLTQSFLFMTKSAIAPLYARPSNNVRGSSLTITKSGGEKSFSAVKPIAL